MTSQAAQSFTGYLEFNSVLHTWPRFHLITVPDNMSWDNDISVNSKPFPTWTLSFGQSKVCSVVGVEGRWFFTNQDLYRLWFLHEYWGGQLTERTLDRYRLAVSIQGHTSESKSSRHERIQVESLIIEGDPEHFFAYRGKNTEDNPVVRQVYTDRIAPYLRQMYRLNHR